MIYPQLDEHYKASLILFELGHSHTQCTDAPCVCL